MCEYKKSFKRYEKKYLLTKEQYSGLREYLDTIAVVDEYGLTTIMNIYYDTPDFRLIRSSLDKPVYKEKLRLRTYGIPSDNSEAFAEIKKKYKGVVYKRRIELPLNAAEEFLGNANATLPEEMMISKEENEGEDSQHPATDRQIGNEIAYFKKCYADLHPTMVISYDRIAMVGIDDPDFRVTFDTGIKFRTDDLDLRQGAYGKEILPKDTILMELKISGAMPVELAQKMSELKIFDTSFSKYGTAYMDTLRTSEKTEEVRQESINKKDRIVFAPKKRKIAVSF